MILQFLNGDKSGEKKQVMPPGIGIGRETDNDIPSWFSEGERGNRFCPQNPPDNWSIKNHRIP